MLFDQIYKDYISARKERNQKKLEFLGYLRSEIANYAKAAKKDKLEDNEVIKILKKQEKKLKEAKDSSQHSGRKDIQENLKSELTIIAQYLPQPLSPQEINQIIDSVISVNQATSLLDMGKIMRIVLKKIGTKSDPQYISRVVKEKLSSQ